MFTRSEVEQWLTQARALNLTDTTSLEDIRYLEHLLMRLPPKETALLANYPNPFNPETWIPFHCDTENVNSQVSSAINRLPT